MKIKITKFLFVLPTFVTLTGMFFGFASILISAGAVGKADYFRAAVAIILAMICDVTDGRVARLTKTQSEFGVQIDSLADLLSFGVAPAVLVYKWGLQSLGSWGILIAALYLISGAMRLARFNVASNQGKTSGKYFLGLPIPGAAGMIVSLVILHQQMGSAPVNKPVNVMWVVVILSYLMVSNVRYRTFKKVRPTLKIFVLTTAVLVALWVLAIFLSPPFIMVTITSAYITMGLLEEFILYPKPKIKLRRRKKEYEDEPIDLELDDEALDDSSAEDDGAEDQSELLLEGNHHCSK